MTLFVHLLEKPTFTFRQTFQVEVALMCLGEGPHGHDPAAPDPVKSAHRNGGMAHNKEGWLRPNPQNPKSES